jgi:hypothetical protein
MILISTDVIFTEHMSIELLLHQPFSGVDCPKKHTNAWEISLAPSILLGGVIFKHKYNYVFFKCITPSLIGNQ